jgi:hypothetical protein
MSKGKGSIKDFFASLLFVASIAFFIGIFSAVFYQFFTLGFNIINKLIGMI